MKRLLLVACSFVFVTAFATYASAKPVVICIEDSVSGCVTTIPTSVPPVLVASDGESAFDPFGAGFDTSDGIVLNSGWTYIGPANSWVQVSTAGFGDFVWVMPATIPNCGTENEPECEPVGEWVFAAGAWLPGTPETMYMLEGDGSGLRSDIIRAFNVDGQAHITFDSLVPEPATLTLLGTGLLGALYRRRRLARQ